MMLMVISSEIEICIKTRASTVAGAECNGENWTYIFHCGPVAD
jgi:hypothetical protein